MSRNKLNTVKTLTEKVTENLTIEMIKVKGGTFQMGTENADPELDPEFPLHEVKVSTFYMGKYLVTNRDYVVFLNDIGKISDDTGMPWINLEGQFNNVVCGIERGSSTSFMVKKGVEDFPMIFVSWFGAKAYCNWLSEKTRREYRLPSEAEWEYAAKGGIENKGLMYAGSNKLKEVGWSAENSSKSNFPVQLKFPNELGFYDMTGNVGEWCEDHWHKNYIEAPIDGSVWLKGDYSSRRVIRGGGFMIYGHGSFVFNRREGFIYSIDSTTGFRVVCG